MSAGKFELFQKKDCVQVDGNIVTAIETEVSISTADSILGKAIEKHPKTFPALTPNNASTVLVFHTESGTQTLAAIRKNPDVDALFPEQINGSTGGYLPPEHCSGSFKKALLTTLSQKLLLNNELLEKLKSESNDEGLKALNRLTLLHDAIATNDGWGSIIAVHAHEAWKMCVLTAVKHITCSDADLTQIQRDLALLMPIEKQRIESITPAGERPNLRTISNFQILKLAPIVSNAQQSYSMDEQSKAEQAQREFPNQVVVTFNDFAMERLATHKGFNLPGSGSVKLNLVDLDYTQTLSFSQ